MRMRPSLRRLSSLGRIFIALALLAVVWFTASQGVDRATRQADDRRLEDWGTFAASYRAYGRAWLDSARAEAETLGRRLATSTRATAGPVIDAYVAQRPAFTTEAALIDPAGMRILAGTADPVPDDAGVKGARDVIDARIGECGGVSGFAELISLARTPERPVVPVLAPWDCKRRVAAVAPAGPNVVVVLAAFDAGEPQLTAAAVGSRRVSLIAPDYAIGDLEGLSQRERLVARARSEQRTSARQYGNTVGAYADVGEGWGLLVEQPINDYDSDAARDEPFVVQLFGATVVAAAFGLVFVLLVIFDARRRRAHARAEDAKHAFFATVGHELRTPLTILKGYSDTLTARWDSLGDDAKEMLVSNMAPAAQRLASLVEKLILASNIQAEAYVKPTSRPTAVPEVLQAVAARFRPLAPLHSFVVDVDPLLPEALADPDALRQVLEQLVDNAVKYSPTGGRVTVSAFRARRGIELAVSDEGVGLPHNADEIFEPLVQGESVDTRVHDEGGAGVGLYIVRTLVRDMGGSVRAEAGKPVGSRFVIKLRAAKTKAAARPVARV